MSVHLNNDDALYRGRIDKKEEVKSLCIRATNLISWNELQNTAGRGVCNIKNMIYSVFHTFGSLVCDRLLIINCFNVPKA